MATLRRFWRDEAGTETVEWAIIIGLIAVGAIVTALAIGNGGMYLCNWFERLAELFEPAIEVAAFGGHDPMDPMEHLDCWLSDERSREINRKHGFARAQRDHTYPVRVRQLLAEIEARR